MSYELGNDTSSGFSNPVTIEPAVDSSSDGFLNTTYEPAVSSASSGYFDSRSTSYK